MRLCLDKPAPDATPENYAPYLTADVLSAWPLYQSNVLRDIYHRQDRPDVAIFLECDPVAEAQQALAAFSRVNADRLSFGCIPLAAFTHWESLFATECRHPAVMVQ